MVFFLLQLTLFFTNAQFTEPSAGGTAQMSQIHPILYLSQEEMIQHDKKGGYRPSLVFYLII